MRMIISHTDIPESLRNSFSKEQLSYIDEFKFYDMQGAILVSYAGEDIALWSPEGAIVF